MEWLRRVFYRRPEWLKKTGEYLVKFDQTFSDVCSFGLCHRWTKEHTDKEILFIPIKQTLKGGGRKERTKEQEKRKTKSIGAQRLSALKKLLAVEDLKIALLPGCQITLFQPLRHRSSHIFISIGSVYFFCFALFFYFLFVFIVFSRCSSSPV